MENLRHSEIKWRLEKKKKSKKYKMPKKINDIDF